MNYHMFLYQKLRFADICENKVIHFTLMLGTVIMIHVVLLPFIEM